MKKIVIICGPSASGKDALLSELLKDQAFNFKKVVTCTTRPNDRSFEKEGYNYHYLTDADFREKINAGYFFEHKQTHGFLYGTPKNAFENDVNYLMQIDIRGALEIKKQQADVYILFIIVPKKQLVGRLQKRGETQEMIKVRLKTAERECQMMSKADAIIENPDGLFDLTLEKAKTAIAKFLTLS
jgi:guanylate kinase